MSGFCPDACPDADACVVGRPCALMATCVIRDTGPYVACETHDIQAEPAWPDAAGTGDRDWLCPVAADWAAFEQTRRQG